MSQLIVDGNEIIPGSIEVTTTNTSITPKDNLQVVLNINQVSSTAVVGSGTDLGMRMSLINKNSNACTVIFGGEGGTVSYTLALNKTLKLVWVGTYWIGTVGGVLSGVDNAGNSFSYNTETVLHAIPQNTQYTTVEADTGMKWIDGKKIYRIVLSGAPTSLETVGSRDLYGFSVSLPHETIVNISGTVDVIYNGNPTSYILGGGSFSSDLANQFDTIVNYNSTNVGCSLVTKHGWWITSITKFTLIVEYTKTTD